MSASKETADRGRTAIFASVGRLRRRWILVQVARSGLRAAFYALFVGALALLLLPELGLGTMLALVAACGLAGGAIDAWYRLPREPELAKAFDDQSGLSDRVSSSIELQGEPSAMVAALHEESARAAAAVKPARVYPLVIPREGWLLPLPALLVAAVLLLPGLLNAEPEPDPLVEQVVGANAEELRDLLSREREKEQTPRRKEVVAELEKLLSELEREKLDKKDTLAEVAKMLEKLREEREREQKDKEELKKLLESLRQSEKTKELAEAAERGDYDDALTKLEELIDELEKKLEQMKKDGASEEELAALEKKIQELKELKAKLAKMLQIDMDLAMMGDMIEFLEDFEGDLADISDLDVEFIKHDCKCEKPGL